MGNLKPGATYIYERANGITYAREFGADPGTRQAIGWDHDYKENNLWQEILTAAKTNSALQEALDRVKVLYELSKTDER